MKRLKLYALANEFVLPTDDKPIYMQFGTWPFNDRIMQTFDLGCAKNIITALANEVAAGSPGTPVYQGHPDVAHLAHKYPDKSAWGWIRKIELANERREPCGEGEATGVLMHVDWVTRPKAHAFEYFSPYWVGTETAPMNGKTHMLANEMRSVALLNYPNIKDFRMPNEAQEEVCRNFGLMQELASRHGAANEANYDESKHPRADDGKWTDGAGESASSSSGKTDDVKINDWDDPKTRKMKESLIKMREKTASLREELAQRRAALEKMRQESESIKNNIRGLNVEMWKARQAK